MLVANYKTKSDLKRAKGQALRFTETSLFGPEYSPNGRFAVVGPSAYDRKWYAQVSVENGTITKVV
jgi:hypothetical protein